eukprot:scaffold15135_cov36-Phaeocystis_antarctica.AAC.2
MAEVERQLNARNEALAENKLTQEDMQVHMHACIHAYKHTCMHLRCTCIHACICGAHAEVRIVSAGHQLT